MTRTLVLLLLLTASPALAQGRHACADDAAGRAAALLKLHLADDALGKSIAIATEVRSLPPVKALKGNGRFDVLELWGNVLKAQYRMRFLYARLAGSCVLMGEEILEASDPY